MQPTLIRSLRRAALLAIAVAPAARAQERALFTWNGRVDNEVHVMVHSAAISSELVSGAETLYPRVVHVSPLPRREGTVRIELLAGRGTVSVLQQPSAGNGYTAHAVAAGRPRNRHDNAAAVGCEQLHGHHSRT